MPVNVETSTSVLRSVMKFKRTTDRIKVTQHQAQQEQQESDDVRHHGNGTGEGGSQTGSKQQPTLAVFRMCEQFSNVEEEWKFKLLNAKEFKAIGITQSGEGMRSIEHSSILVVCGEADGMTRVALQLLKSVRVVFGRTRKELKALMRSLFREIGFARYR